MTSRSEQLVFTVSDDEDGCRLDRLVARHAGVSRRIARTRIGQGKVRVRGKPIRIISRCIRCKSRVTVDRAPVDRDLAGPTIPSIQILHLDRWLVAVAKPPGLLSESDRVGAPSLESEVPKLLEAAGERQLDLRLVHRLDAGTSGVILLARTNMATRAMNKAFAEGRVDKRYLALCLGRFGKPRTVDAAIGRIKGTRQGVRRDGKAARTRFESIATSDAGSLVRAIPKTGRTHQIRVHLAHIDHPIIGDRLYGGPGYTDDTPPEPIPRPMLHAESLRIAHPKTNEPLRIRVEPPEDFVAQVQRLGLKLQP